MSAIELVAHPDLDHGIGGDIGPFGHSLAIPHWPAALLMAVLAVAPWIRQLKWRFSLRTALISTTLVAVGLGLIVWLSRRNH